MFNLYEKIGNYFWDNLILSMDFEKKKCQGPKKEVFQGESSNHVFHADINQGHFKVFIHSVYFFHGV